MPSPQHMKRLPSNFSATATVGSGTPTLIGTMSIVVGHA